MRFTRQRYQFGSLRSRPRKKGPPVWEFRYYETVDGKRVRKPVIIGDLRQYPNKNQARRACEALLLEINSDSPRTPVQEPTFGALIDRFIADERLIEISQQKPGELAMDGLAYSTALCYLSNLNGHIRPKWGALPISAVRPAAVLEWLRGLAVRVVIGKGKSQQVVTRPAAPKTKGHMKATMHRLFEKAMLWEYVEVERNPMELVEVKGVSKRRKKPVVLTVDQYYRIVQHLPQPYRTMVIVAACTGLRASEILALEWSNIDFERLVMRVDKAVVNGRTKRVKTSYSEDELPLDPDFASVLLAWKRQGEKLYSPLVFPSHLSGRTYHASPIQQDYIRPAGENLGLKGVGWHTFRHSYRAWLDSVGAPVGVQQKLMRHAQISTTMDVYGDSLMEAKREANSKVVRMVLRSA